MSKDTPPLGRCPACGANMDLIGKAHRCVPAPQKVSLPSGEELEYFPVAIEESPALKKLRRTPKGRTRGGKKVEVPATPANIEKLQEVADSVKKRGRPAKRTPEERKAMRAELMRKKRAEAKK